MCPPGRYEGGGGRREEGRVWQYLHYRGAEGNPGTGLERGCASSVFKLFHFRVNAWRRVS